MKQTKICHLITRLDLGGSAENTLITAIGMRKIGYEVDLVCGASDNPPSRTEQEALTLGVTIIRMKNLVRPISLLHDTLALLALVRLFNIRRYDLLHTHTSKAGIVGRVAGLIARVPVMVHTPHGHIFYGYFSAGFTVVFTRLERIVTRWTHALITLTNKEKRDYLERNIGTPERIHPILSGIDLAPYLTTKTCRQELRASIGLSGNDFVAGTVARLVPVKNHDLIISAADLIKERCPDLRFVFIGDGEMRPRIEERLRSLGLTNRFILTGWRNDIAECLSLFNLFVMCSHNEGMGRAFVEAQASGVPVIGSRVGGVEEVVAEGTTGFLIDPQKPDELAGVLERLYNNRAGCARMAAACRAHVDPAFGKERMVEKIDALYRRLLSIRIAP